MRIGYATDIHLDAVNLVRGAGVAKYHRIGRFMAEGQDVLLITGDISTGKKFPTQFGLFCRGAGIPVYFVLGNHDFWDVPEATVRENAAKFPGYLDVAGVVELAPGLGLTGRTGWYDTLSGNPFESRVTVQDWKRVERLEGLWAEKYLLSRACKAWSEEEAEKARPVLIEAAERFPNVLFLTHFPCFVAACWDELGNLDTEERGFRPWSINTTMGHMIDDVVTAYPKTQFTVLSGHTHGRGRKQLRDNLTCVSGKASYGSPKLAESWTYG